jgi:general L-amino acid transport system permease protein
MAVESLPRPASSPKVALLNDPVFRGRVYQTVLAVAVVVFFVWIGANTVANLKAQNKAMGFDFLWLTSGFDISFHLIPYDRSSLYIEAFFVGLTNTLLVAAIGIVFATLLGFIAGIARLSSNWLVRSIATVYIEVFRNVPLLVQLFFWYFGVLKAMPPVKQSLVLFGGVVANQRGLYVPRPLLDDRFVWVVAALVIAIVGSLIYRTFARRLLERTGRRLPVAWVALAAIVLLPSLAWLVSGTNLQLELPTLQGFNYKGGYTLPPELVALTFGLVWYTGTFIAEIVRAGITSVSKGQTEAAQALGLRESDRLRLVILPQAMRVIVPPLTSQFLNLTKNSSLGAFIGYPDLVNVFAGTALNQTGRAIEIITMTMLVYLTFSLTTSAFMNWYNARVALKER